MLNVEHLTKTYATGSHELAVLKDVTFSVAQGEACSLVGPSGSGKTTLLGLCAGLDRPTSGSVALLEVELTTLSEDELSDLRGASIGFVFQSFQLIPTLTAVENVMVPLELRGERQAEPQSRDLLDRVGLGDRADHYPAQLSGGEQQRVAIARALVNKPAIILADEPTGALDTQTGEEIMELIDQLHAQGNTIILVTHEEHVARHSRRVIRFRDGMIESDEVTT